MDTKINHIGVESLKLDSRLIEERYSNLELTPMLSTTFLSHQLEQISDHLTVLDTILQPSQLASQLGSQLSSRVKG